MSLVEGKIKWEKRWRENNDSEGGGPLPLGGFSRKADLLLPL